MPDHEVIASPQNEQQPTQTAPAPASPGYSQADVDAAVRAAKDAAWAEARRTFEGRQAKPSKSEQRDPRADKAEAPAPDRFQRALRQRDALDDALASRQVTTEQRRLLRGMMETADPDEPDAWAQSTLEILALGNSPATATPMPTPGKWSPPPTPNPAARPQSDQGAPQSLPPWERPSNPFEWTNEDIERLRAQKGAREAQRIIRKKAEEFARTMKIVR